MRRNEWLNESNLKEVRRLHWDQYDDSVNIIGAEFRALVLQKSSST